MKIQFWPIRRRFGLVLVVLSVLVIVTVMAVEAGRKQAKTRSLQTAANHQQEEQRVTDTLPSVISSIKGIEVVSAFIDGHGQANITVVNNTGKGITGLAISSGNLMFSDDNGLTQDNPAALIPPNSSYTLQQPVSNLRANRPIRVSAAFYDDGTEEGDASVRKNIHDTRDREREKRLLHSNKEKGN